MKIAQAESQERWAVVGGGFLGMTLALRLRQQGKRVVVFEAAPALGGLASSWQLGDVTWDRHYHVILPSDNFLLSLLGELKLADQTCWQKARTGFYIDSKLYSMSSAMEFLRFPPLSLWEKWRLGSTIVRASRIKDWKPLERICVEEWLLGLSGAAVTEKMWLPLLRAKLGESYRDTSAAFIWATIARMYSARRNGTKSEQFGYVTGGYARIIDRFGQLLGHEGIELQVGQAVRSIRKLETGELRLETADGSGHDFDQVVVTVAAPLAARMCSELSIEERNQLCGIRYHGIICASLLLKRPLSKFYITNIADQRIPFTAVIEMSSLVDGSNFGERALVYLPQYISSESLRFGLSDEEIRNDFLAALEQMHPKFSREDLLCFQISRVKYLLPIPTLGYSEKLPPVSTSVAGLHILNSAHIVNGTLNVNETIQLAESGARAFSTVSRSPVGTRHALAEAYC